MSLLCSCPIAASLTAIPEVTCPEDIGQIQKIIIQREKQADGTLNAITIASTNPNELATWSTLKSASDYTKVVISPFIHNPSTAVGEPIYYGGSDNTTVDGVPLLVGRDFTQFTGEFIRVPQSVIKVIKTLECEGETTTGLSIFMIDEHSRIWGLSTDSGTTFTGVPIQSFFVCDKLLGGKNEPDRNAVNWSFKPNWSDYLYSITPVTGFDPLRDL